MGLDEGQWLSERDFVFRLRVHVISIPAPPIQLPWLIQPIHLDTNTLFFLVFSHLHLPSLRLDFEQQRTLFLAYFFALSIS